MRRWGWGRTYPVVVKREFVGAILALLISGAGVIAPATAARAEASELCRFDGKRLAEISGLAYSSLHEGIVWAHNDSGGGARLYALDIESCAIRAVLRVRGITARDPEALATGTSATGTPVLWWGDIGDNTSSRDYVEVHEIPEPADLRDARVRATTYRVRLDDGQDSEALLADGGRLWLIGKGLIQGRVWALPYPLRADKQVRARVVGAEEGLVTDAAMRPGGGYAVRDYSEVRIYTGSPPGTLAARMPLPEQVQGEAMTWTSDGTALIIASEGDDRLLLVPVEAETAEPAPSPSPTHTPATPAAPAAGTETEASPQPNGSAQPSPSGSPVAAALEPVDRVGSLAVLALAVGAGVFIASAAAVAIVVRLRARH